MFRCYIGLHMLPKYALTMQTDIQYFLRTVPFNFLVWLLRLFLLLFQIIVERYERETSLPLLDKRKFLVPQEITMSQFVAIIRYVLKEGLICKFLSSDTYLLGFLFSEIEWYLRIIRHFTFLSTIVPC